MTEVVPVLRMEGVSKHYGGVRALREARRQVGAGADSRYPRRKRRG